MRRTLLLLLFASAACLLGAERALGCTCLNPPPPCQAAGQASAVFVGTVKDAGAAKKDSRAERGWDMGERVFKFSVEKSFKGAGGKSVEVYTGSGGGDCGYGFVVGVRYLVYAYLGENDKRLRTSICSRTRPATAEAGEDLEYFEGLATAPKGASLYGEVRRYTRGDGRHPRAEGPQPGITVVLSVGGGRKQTRTDEQGRFRFEGLPPGDVTVEARPPDGLYTDKPQTVWVEDKGCAVVGLSVYSFELPGGAQIKTP